MQIYKNLNFNTCTTYFMSLFDICFYKMSKINGISPLAREFKTHLCAISILLVCAILYLSNLTLNTSREVAQGISNQSPTFPYASLTKMSLGEFIRFVSCQCLKKREQKYFLKVRYPFHSNRAPSQTPNEARITQRLTRK